ncbi:MAG TPA: DUF896 domain-containing protein [Eubacteriales bacterium]|nr:DUF896 domain-containing protein [Eubacteriales bacterium]
MVNTERINFLAKKSREQGLTEEEKAEQELLRKEYVEAVKRNMKAQLENIVLVDDNGNPIEKTKKH